ncbi:MAG: S41 family peptidase, partial [Bacteroidota bacterium]
SDIKDAHTEIALSKPTRDAVDESLKLLPLGLRWIEGQLYISRNLSTDDRIPRGAILNKINGEDALALFAEFLPLIERDGNNLTSPRRSTANLFMDFYGLLKAQPDSFEVVFTDQEERKQQIRISSQTWPQQLKNWEKRYGPIPEGAKEQLSFTIEGEVATMKVKSWHPGRIKSGGQNFKKFFQDAFEEITSAGVKHLILDMRNNGGGSEVVFMQCFGHLVNQTYTVYKELSAITVDIPDHQYYPYDNVKRLEAYGKKAMEKRGERYHTKKDPSLKPAKPLHPYYDGKLYVLINERSHSATGDLSGVMRKYKRGLFIGNESGGNPFENTAGESPTLYLPNTGLRVSIPLLKYVINRDLENTGQGIIPEHRIIPSMEDILNKKDVVMAYTLDLIKKSNSKK